MCSGVGGGVVNGRDLGARGVESTMSGRVPGEMENLCSLKFCSVCLARCSSLPTFLCVHQ